MFKETPEGTTHYACKKHFEEGIPLCCECSMKKDCSDSPQTDGMEERFDNEEWIKNLLFFLNGKLTGDEWKTVLILVEQKVRAEISLALKKREEEMRYKVEDLFSINPDKTLSLISKKQVLSLLQPSQDSSVKE